MGVFRWGKMTRVVATPLPAEKQRRRFKRAKYFPPLALAQTKKARISPRLQEESRSG
jgi:hypothetical protein